MAESAVSGQFFKDILNEMHALYLRQQGSKALDADLLLCESRDTKGARMIFSACYVRYMCVCTFGDETVANHRLSISQSIWFLAGHSNSPRGWTASVWVHAFLRAFFIVHVYGRDACCCVSFSVCGNDQRSYFLLCLMFKM